MGLNPLAYNLNWEAEGAEHTNVETACPASEASAATSADVPPTSPAAPVDVSAGSGESPRTAPSATSLPTAGIVTASVGGAALIAGVILNIEYNSIVDRLPNHYNSGDESRSSTHPYRLILGFHGAGGYDTDIVSAWNGARRFCPHPTAAFVITALAAFSMVALLAPLANARTMRPLFEPTDLEMEPTGVLDIDVQVGAIRSPGPWRAVMPDFELDFGLLPYLELDLDGAYAVEGRSTGPFSFDHAAPDSLWPSLKLGLYDEHDGVSQRAWALGFQVGPKIPVAPGAHGLGGEGLLLVGYLLGPLHTVLNLGAFADPAPDASSGRPLGIEAGLDFELDLDDVNRFSLTGEVSGVRFVSGDPHQLLATAGLKWAVSPFLELTAIGLWGFLAGSDRYGALLGISPKFLLFRR